ncbi:730_t:CDS:2, partial [Racocetra persica]
LVGRSLLEDEMAGRSLPENEAVGRRLSENILDICSIKIKSNTTTFFSMNERVRETQPP